MIDDPLWPFVDGAHDAGLAVSAVDLLEHGDQRAARAGKAMLQRVGALKA